jgi:ABC-type transport system involved in cytochrome c biogenesis permease subunit
MRCRNIFCVATIALLATAAFAKEAPTKPDFGAWQRMPCFHNGRMMPVNTFARAMVETVCHRANPRLSLDGALQEGADEPPGFAEAKRLFPDGEARKFTSAELLFSWLVEPHRWKHVPFLIAEFDALRTNVLDVPVHGPEGKHLKYVSPAQVARSRGFRKAIEALNKKRREARVAGEEAKLTEVEKKLDELYDAYTVYRFVTFDPLGASADISGNPVPAGSDARRFLNKLMDVVTAWNAAAPELDNWVQLGVDDGTRDLSNGIGQSVDGLRSLVAEEGYTLAKAEPMVVSFRESTSALAEQLGGYRRRLMTAAPPGVGESQLREFRNTIHTMASLAEDLDRKARELHLSLYDNGHCLRLVPALNPAALERNRNDDDDAQPWLSLQALIVGSDAVLADYPRPELDAVRNAFRKVAAAYIDRKPVDRPERFGAAISQFASAVRALGESIEPIRAELPVKDQDKDLIRATAYPPIGSTETEVHYYALDPFLWSWLLGLGSVVCLSLSFGFLRKPMFWLGTVLLVLAQAFIIYGLGLRVAITGWAPVTNMFETVIFVALVVAALGLWFAMLPVTWTGLSAAWRLTAVPGTPEATPLTDEQKLVLSEHQWTVGSLLVLIPRAALAAVIFYLLTMVPYGSGEGYSIVPLLPRTDVGSSMPTVGNVVVWLVGISMLLLGMWIVPRTILTCILGLVSVPYALARRGLAKPLNQVLARKPFVLAGATVGFLAGLVAYYAPALDKDIGPLMPVLRDNFWLTVHVLTITASYGAGALAWGLGLIALFFYLVGRYRDPVEPSPEAVAAGHRPADGYHAPPDAFRRRAPEVCNTLGTHIYKATQVAVLLLAAGTILGGLWADVSWGRFWGWDSKEVWALISLLIYLAVLHGRYAGWFGNFGLAVGSVIGVTSILMAWYGVNFVLGSGLHTYASGAGGLGWAILVVASNWGFAVAAAIRYRIETGRAVAPSQAGRGEGARVVTEETVEV